MFPTTIFNAKKNAYFIKFKTFDFTNLFFFTHTQYVSFSSVFNIIHTDIFKCGKADDNSTQQLDSKPDNPLKQCYLSVAAFYLFVTGII